MPVTTNVEADVFAVPAELGLFAETPSTEKFVLGFVCIVCFGAEVLLVLLFLAQE